MRHPVARYAGKWAVGGIPRHNLSYVSGSLTMRSRCTGAVPVAHRSLKVRNPVQSVEAGGGLRIGDLLGHGDVAAPVKSPLRPSAQDRRRRIRVEHIVLLEERHVTA